MRLFLPGAALVLFCISLVGSPAHAQASVNETLETAYYWVDAVNGSDSNPGTQAAPFQTISMAVSVAEQNNQQGIGSHISINPGTYRESITITASVNDTALPITFEATTPGTVFVTGADVWTGWQQDSNNANLYTDPWPYQWGLCDADVPPAPPETDIVRRREMIFVNGTSLTQVLSLTDLVFPGMFFVDETGGQVYIYPPAGTDVNSATIEVSTRSEDVTLWNKNGVVFRGMTFQGASSCRHDHAVYVHGTSTNILLDNDTIEWNNSDGVRFDPPSTNFTIQNSTANFNGRSGVYDYQVKNALYQNDTFDYNNWRGAQGAYYPWGASGAYLFSEHGDTVTGITANFNQASGIHWDTNNENVVASNLFTAKNLIDGVFVEKNDGPVNVSGLTACNNGVNGYTSWQPQSAGFVLRNSEYVTLTQSTLYGNNMNGLFVEGVAGGISVTNWETGQVYNLISQYFTNTSNIIESLLSTEYVFNDGVLGGTDWTTFQSTLTSNQNTWWNPLGTVQFIVPTPTENTYTDFAGWQSVTGQDANSSYSAPVIDPGAACTVAPTANDFWFIVDNGTPVMDPSGTTVYTFTVDPLVFSGTVNLMYDLEGISGVTAALSNSSIETSGTATLTVSAAITAPAGTYQFPVIANGGAITHTSYVFLTIPQTSIRIVPAVLSFPATQINYTSAPETAVMTNYGTAPVTLTSITTSPQFVETNTCNGMVPPNGGSCTLSVTFVPNGATTFNGSMTVTDSDPASPQIVVLTGTGLPAPETSLSMYALAYGLQPIGSNTTMTAVLTNTGAGVLDISSVAITGTDPGDYSQTNTCGTSVQPGGACTFTVIFTPSALNQRTATLTITDNSGAGGMQTVSLTGNGTQPSVQLPVSTYFGSQMVGTSSTKMITLTNGGNGPLNITSMVISGTNFSDFSQVNTCGAQLAAYSSCTLTAVFAPSLTGSESASLTVTDNAPDSPQVVAFSGKGTNPSLIFAPNPLDFKNEMVNTTSATQSIVITNNGKLPATIISISVTGLNATDFAITQTCNVTILSVGSSCTVSLQFTPSALGGRSADLTVISTAPGSPQNFTLAGNGTESVASLSAASLAFGQQLLNTATAPQIVTLSNTGNSALNIGSIKLTGTNTNWFSETNTCGARIGAGSSCDITVTFTPLANGAGSASVSISDNANPSSQTINLSGTGVSPVVTIAPSQLSFGSVVLGASALAQTATVTNTGTDALTITSITLGGVNPGDFSQVNSCGSSLGVAASCTITVTFTPTATGNRMATVTLADDTSAGSQALAVEGSGTQASSTVTPSSFSFGNQNVGQKSGGMTATLTNAGTAPLAIISFGFTGANPGDFSDTTTCGTTLPAGQSCNVSVYFQPTLAAAESASLMVTSDAPQSPQSISLSGTGVQAFEDLAPITLAFGNQLVNTASLPQTATLTNTGNESLAITSISLTGKNANWFAAASTCGASLASGSSCSITITFTPLANGNGSASLSVTDSAPGSPQTVSLSGTGVVPLVKLVPGTLLFGDVPLGSSSSPMTVTLTNTGTGVLSIASVSILGANPGDFSQTNTCGIMVNPGATCTFSVLFTPSAKGTRSANISLADNATNSPQTVSLMGTGTQATASLSPVAINFGSQKLGTKSVGMKATLTNTGNAPLTISSIGFTGQNASDFSDTTGCGASLPAGKSCTTTVFFLPSLVGSEAADLSLTTNAPDSPETVSLSGKGTRS